MEKFPAETTPDQYIDISKLTDSNRLTDNDKALYTKITEDKTSYFGQLMKCKFFN